MLMSFMHGDGAGERGSGTVARSLGWRCLLTYDIGVIGGQVQRHGPLAGGVF